MGKVLVSAPLPGPAVDHLRAAHEVEVGADPIGLAREGFRARAGDHDALVTLVTGMLLFLTDPPRFVANPFFLIKTVALVLAAMNILIFHAGVYSRVREWDNASSPPRAARISAAVSLALWAVVLVASRLVAYNWFG